MHEGVEHLKALERASPFNSLALSEAIIIPSTKQFHYRRLNSSPIFQSSESFVSILFARRLEKCAAIA
ncbi:hypothetical protein BIW11_04420 [Tropilaelaps mercedesae]|uniref:Uncharacterized protein n=1 Tax=Tropilaelaps mercedesae TaxID=418985 RepID=A0A1V9X718_9ACAR|nr:hypothetical protein BIW11_04420 [Tropilaelaps mercedesae]